MFQSPQITVSRPLAARTAIRAPTAAMKRSFSS
ncbi:Uncharacterised protein [Mycobacteroides abscessus subsp. abscessus]|nr:Uncharacterised protein [Mycobacteroides abscessus subsp. abscessus]